MRIAVIGAGTAGLAAAFLLADRHQVTVFERVGKPAPVGAGLLLQPSGLEVLRRMGLFESVVQLGARIDQLYGTLRDRAGGNGRGRPGWPVMDMRYCDYAPAAFGLAISRHALFETLWRAAAMVGVEVRAGVEVADLRQDQHGVQLLVADGQRLPGDFDLCLVAGGTFTPLRERVGVAHQVRPYPWGALWAMLPDHPRCFDGQLRQWYRGANQMLGLMPTGWQRIEDQRQPPWISLFWSVRADRLDALRARPLGEWKAEVLALAPTAAPYLEMIEDWSQLAWARYADVRLRQPWQGRVLFIGDAAHAMSPQLGQGANMALLDAWLLGWAMRTRQPGQPLADAVFRRFADERRRHLGYYQFASRWLTPLFQSDGRIVPALRNAVFWPMSRLPPFRQSAVRTLCGMVGNWWGGLLELPD